MAGTSQGLGSSTTITIQTVAAKAGINRVDVLDQECSRQDLLNLAKYCVDWQMIGRHLGLSDADIAAVDGDNRTIDEKRIGMLGRWKERFAFGATYRVFIEALLSCGKASDAIEACKATLVKSAPSGTATPLEVEGSAGSQVDRSPHPPAASTAGKKRRDAPGSDTSDGNTDNADASTPATKKSKRNSTQAKEVTTFDSSMSDKDFLKWLRSKGMSQKDSKALPDNGVTAAGFLQFDAKDFDGIELTRLGKTLLLKIFNELKGPECDQQSSETGKTQERDEHTINGQHASGTLATPTKPQSPPTTSPAAATKLEVLPTQKQLLKFKYTERGEKKNLEIISRASHKWRDIASLLSDDPNVANTVEKKHPGDVNECLKLVFTDYFIGKKPQDYSHDWNGVIEVLEDVGLQTLADNVNKAVSLGGQTD